MNIFNFLLVKKIVSKAGVLHFCRWRLLQTPWFGIYIHKICKSDEEKHHHDHPWAFISFVILGGYKEEVFPANTFGFYNRICRPGSIVYHKAKDFHKITLLKKSAWTLVFVGKRSHDPWGYRTESGWVNNETYRREKNKQT